jgi:hypothetical protein
MEILLEYRIKPKELSEQIILLEMRNENENKMGLDNIYHDAIDMYIRTANDGRGG